MIRMRYAVLAVALVATPALAATRTGATSPSPGVVHETWTEPAIPARLHVVVVDLTSAELTVRATREDDRGLTAAQLAARLGAQIVINGDYFAPGGWVPDGLAVGDGAPWSTARDDARAGVLRFGKVQSRTDALILVPEQVVVAADLPSFTTGAIGGRPMLVRAGQPPSSFDCGDADVLACVRAPRSAVGLSDDNRRLWLVTVDGWQDGSTGMTAAELAGFLRDRGVRDALLLDGGGASQLFIAGQGGLVSAPSDGVARPVANHLAITHGAQAPGTLLGKVADRSLSGPPLAGVKVELDDGRTVTTGTAEIGYEFGDVRPRYACVTASKPGYNTATQCRQVEPGILNYNSIVLFPAGTGPDAGVPVDAGAPDAAGGLTDGGDVDARGDGGAGIDGDGGAGDGGCCSTGGGDPTATLALCALVVVSRRLPGRPRRRRT